MTENQLDLAIRALREETSGQSEEARRTELAILNRLSRPNTNYRQSWRVYGWALAALLGSSTVWALVGPVRTHVAQWLGKETPARAVVTGDRPSRARAPQKAKPVEPTGEDAPVTPLPSGSEAMAQAPPPRPSQAKLHLENAPLTRSSMSEELAVYRGAYEAQFVDHRTMEALALWDKYLARFPSGTFAPEARFSRALCLLGLGRSAEARFELLPFAEGSGYRKTQALELLATLEGSTKVPAVDPSAEAKPKHP